MNNKFEFILQYHWDKCPKCKGKLHMDHKGRNLIVAVLLMDKVQEGVLKRKLCKVCRILIGPHYYYAKGAADRGEYDGVVTLGFHMLHDPSSVFLMVDPSEKVFVQRRQLETLYLDVFKNRMSVSATAQRYLANTPRFMSTGQPGALLGQAAGICVPSQLPSKLSCPSGKWLQQALDLHMVLEAVTDAHDKWERSQPAQHEQQQPSELLVWLALRGAVKRQAEAQDQDSSDEQQQQLDEDDEDDTDAAWQQQQDYETDVIDAPCGQQPQPQHQQPSLVPLEQQQQQHTEQEQQDEEQEQQEQVALVWVPDRVPAGTLHQLMRRWVVGPVLRHYGNFAWRSHTRCSMYLSSHQPPELQQLQKHPPVLLLDATVNIQVHVCGVPGCRGLLEMGTDLWCEQHTPDYVPRGAAQRGVCCQVACRSGAGAWQACDEQREQGTTFCSQHQHMQRRCGAAAAAERQGLHSSWRRVRHDKEAAAAGASRAGGAGGDAPGPDTPGRAAAAAADDDSSSDSPSQVAGDQQCMYVGAKALRGVVAMSCAHCGTCCGFSPMFSGQAETSTAGLSDVLATVEGIVRHCLAGSSSAAAGSSASKPPLPPLCIVYNDAAAMVLHLQAAAPADVQETFKNVEWSVDILRFLPTLLRMSAQDQAAGAQQAGGQQAGGQQEQERAAADIIAPHVSPFRPAMDGKLVRRIRYQHAQPWLQLVGQELCRLLPSQEELEAVRAGAPTGNKLLQLLSRANFARLSPGVVSLSEIVTSVLPNASVKPAQRHRVFFRFEEHVPGEHDGTASSSSSSSSSSSRWNNCLMSDDANSAGVAGSSAAAAAAGRPALRVSACEVLVDTEAMERLWGQLQPGSTISLKTQAHALADLKARLDLHNTVNALELAALRDWVSAHYQAQPGQVWNGTPLLPTRAQLRDERGLMRPLAVQLAKGPYLQQQVQAYCGLSLPAGNWLGGRPTDPDDPCMYDAIGCAQLYGDVRQQLLDERQQLAAAQARIDAAAARIEDLESRLAQAEGAAQQ